MQEKGRKSQLLPNMFVALLGVYNLNNSIEIGRTPYAIQSVNIHPEWSIHSESFDADIAVLVVETEVIYNKYIQPACVIYPNTNEVTITKGLVVGFGQSEDTTKVHENIPKVLEMPIHKNEDCFFEHKALLSISSKRTFCAGTGHGIGVCRGDSGGGLYVFQYGAYALRGIVSSSLIGGPYGCDVDAYSVFTDVINYIDWINEIPISRFD
jgi:secreted trypsin-like serine protease